MKAELRQDALKSWQRAWDTSDKGRSLHEYKPQVKLNQDLPADRWGIVTKLFRLKTGHSQLNEHMHRMHIPGYDTPVCACGQDTANVTHYLLHCPLHTHIRDTTISSIETLFVKNNIPPAYRVINICTLLGDSNQLTSSVRSAIETCVLGFIKTLVQSLLFVHSVYKFLHNITTIVTTIAAHNRTLQ